MKKPTLQQLIDFMGFPKTQAKGSFYYHSFSPSSKPINGQNAMSKMEEIESEIKDKL